MSSVKLSELTAETLAAEYRKARAALSKKAREVSGKLDGVKSFNMGHLGSGTAPPTSDMLRDRLNSVQHHFSLLAVINVDIARIRHVAKAAAIKLGAMLKYLLDKGMLGMRGEIEGGKKMTVGVMEATVRVDLSEAILASAELDASVEKIMGLHDAVRAVHSHLSQNSDTLSQMIRLMTWEGTSMKENVV